ncbi:adenylate/guanylate cyclase domain-containing protein [Phormidium sp. CLA17]|uniref:adenylate/guanylate cyclase domain-containing protein n=1 Tax=Leptolyngbya sp. Cla-17 TaxID=2803751 RepID=UPI0014913FFB|nr:adenylate/guanylate cyclase domain-containing protein [Leptolyngbya sp. Cla-17]MBM0742991.1 adenylate/guanylate cyclase domain-containing protein [Leptolyngbya sp. Cla-17]
MTDSNHLRLHQLLQERIEHPEREEEVDRLIHQIFDQDCAILVLDLSGFSRLTIRHGIIHFLAMVHRMTAIADPIVTHHKGQVIKQEADNLFAVFPEVTMAVNAAIDILKGFAAVNTGLPDDKDLHASIGIGYGTTLVIGDSDLYGSEMNLASKLGEDIARQNEILLTENSYKQLSNASALTWEPLSFSISGLELVSYALRN